MALNRPTEEDASPDSRVREAESSKPLTNARLFTTAVVLTVAFEILTCILRFGLKLESTRDTASVLSHFTCGYRIHHSYIGGVMMIVAGVLWNRSPKWMSSSLAIGLGLFFSDLIHHFLVLWPIVGSPQFDLTYPAS